MSKFSYEEIRYATQDLADLIGKGGFGSVYKGCYHGIPIAIKQLKKVHSAFSERVYSVALSNENSHFCGDRCTYSMR